MVSVEMCFRSAYSVKANLINDEVIAGAESDDLLARLERQGRRLEDGGGQVVGEAEQSEQNDGRLTDRLMMEF